MPRHALPVLVALLSLAGPVACSSSGSPSADAEPAAGTVPADPVATTSTTAPIEPTTTSTITPACTPPAILTASAIEPLPEQLASALRARLADPRFADVDLSASVWIEGYGDVVDHDADTTLFPASNQKVLTALGTSMLLPADGTFTTEVRATGVITDGTLTGDLVLVAGGDPSLTRTGANSLDALATQVRDAGVRIVAGSMVVDVSRHELATLAQGWQDWQVPDYAGPLSAFVVDDNRYRADAEYVAQPSIANGDALVDALRRHGIVVQGTVVHGVVPPGAHVVASTTSPPFAELVAEMLLRSDNEHAEMLVREIAHDRHGLGTTSAGVLHVQEAIEDELCLDLTGRSGDGSGLSRANLRSARELRTIFHAALDSPWGPALDAALPVGGRTGTLARRFGGTAAAGNVRAKTGSIIGGRALTGHLETAGGRQVVLSMIVNGERSPAAQGAIDALVATLADDAS